MRQMAANMLIHGQTWALSICIGSDGACAALVHADDVVGDGGFETPTLSGGITAVNNVWMTSSAHRKNREAVFKRMCRRNYVPIS